MLGSTASVAGVYEHRRTTILIHFQHRSCRHCAAPIPLDIIKKDMSPKGGNRRPAKIFPWEHIGEQVPWDSQREGGDVGVGDRVVLNDPYFGVQPIGGKFVRSRPIPSSLPAGFPFGMEDLLGASRDRGSGGLLRAQGFYEYDPVIRRYQGRSDFSRF